MAGLDEHIQALVSSGDGVEQLHGHAFISLAQLDSGARFGLAVRLRQDLGPAIWARVVDGGLTLFLDGNEKHFVEVLENGRAAFDGAIEAGAAARGLPVDEALLSFPAVGLVRALLATRSPHYCRLALMFVMPSELRELRDAIEPLLRDTAMPQLVRDLASRLVGPAA